MELFELYLKASLTTAVVIALLLMATPLVRKRYPAKWRYVAWLIVALRLLIPFNISLPEAPIQITVPQAAVNTQRPEAPTPNNDAFTESENEASVSTNMIDAGLPVSDAVQKPNPASLVMGIWIAGMLVYFTLQAITYLRFLRRQRFCPRSEVSTATQVEWEAACREANVRHIPEIIASGCVSAPVLTGLLRPRLLLPHDNYTTQEMRFILRHELVHYRRRDLWYKLVLMIAGGVHWFNPLVYIMLSQAHKDVELSCDDAVMSGLGDADRASYGEAILNALPVKREWRLEPVFTTSFGSTKKTMKQRLKNLFDRTIKKRGIAALCAVMVLAATVGGTIVFTPVAAAAESAKEITFSLDNIAAGEAVCIGRIELKSGVSYNLNTSTQSGTQWAVGLNKSGDITTSDESGVAWKQYYGGAGRSQIEALFSGQQTGSYYVYVMSTGSKLTGVSGTLSTDNPSGAIVRKEASMTNAAMKTAVIGNDTWYLVETEAQLRAIAASEESLSRNYMQNADITVTSVWTPIGTEDAPFTGIYNGNGFAIRGLRYKDNEQRRGLFGYADYAYLHNITIVGLGTGPVAAINLDGELTDCAVVSEEEYRAAAKARGATAQTVSFTNVELRRYSSGSPYIHDIIANNTSKRMMTNEICMLAFDTDGNPLKLRWNYLSSSTTPQYSFLYDWGSDEIAPGANNDNEDNNGGWSLFSNTGDTPAEVEQIAYILYTFRSITFADGTVWMNPDYENWLRTYEGKQVDVSALEGYYPHTLSIS